MESKTDSKNFVEKQKEGIRRNLMKFLNDSSANDMMKWQGRQQGKKNSSLGYDNSHYKCFNLGNVRHYKSTLKNIKNIITFGAS